MSFARPALLLVLLAGCSGTPVNTLSGTVTLDSAPVGGLVVLVTGDGRELPAIGTNPDGSYRVKDVPPGDYRVIVKSFPAAVGELPKDARAGLPTPTNRGAEPPAKYAKLEAGLSVTVTGGQQKQDFALTP
jgi:hypothetical protein